MGDGTISNNTGLGVHCGGTSHCEFAGNIHINGNGKGGIEIVEHSDASLDGGLDISTNTGTGVLVDQSSSLTSLGGKMAHFCRATSMTCPPMMVCTEDPLEDNDSRTNIPDATSANIMTNPMSPPCTAAANSVQCSNLVVCPRNGGTSHFIAEYYNGSVIVVELPVKNPQQFHAYTLGGFTGASKPVVTLGVMDMNHDGKPDLLVSVEGTAIQTVLFNTGDSFRMGG